ncbi:hypothetical protein ACS85_21290 [Vibrio parahaemolyticus]|nr:hypothetical protein ACS85_21290 [Vibrio parahaemolyticus]ODX36589.1 hypothetical protein BBM01_08240 [Vibrio parahaemolyticus]
MEYVVVEILRQKHYWSLYNAIVVHTHTLLIDEDVVPQWKQAKRGRTRHLNNLAITSSVSSLDS